MRIHEFPVEQALASLNSGPDGLTAAEAARRLAEYGPNRVEEVAREPMSLRFAREFTHFFASSRTSSRSSCGWRRRWPSRRSTSSPARAWAGSAWPSSASSS